MPMRTYKVFVSSTYLDNIERRKTVQDAITMAGMVWHGMEIFTASTRPTIEACQRYVRESDLLVGIVAWRYGWEPDGERSITEMEYDAAQERLMFQLDPKRPIIPGQDYDPGPDQLEKQIKLKAFKERFAADQMPALFTETTLGTKVLDALHKWRQAKEGRPNDDTSDGKKATDAGSSPVSDDNIRRFRQKAESLHSTLPVAGFVTQLKIPIDIEDIYVPLHAMINLTGDSEEMFGDAAHAESCMRGRDCSLEIALPEAFRQSEMRKRRGLVILGDPGSGKTTHMKRLLLWCLRKGSETLSLPPDMLPVYLPLRELDDLDTGLDAFIQTQLASPHLKMPDGFGAQLLDRGNLILLFDGLDEVADLSQREKVAGWIAEALRCNPDCRFVVTCRFAGYSRKVQLSEDFLEMHIRPLTAAQVERFVSNWYRIVETGLGKDPEQGESIANEKATHLIERLREPDFRSRRVFELTRNPLLLTNICLVHRHRGSLPRRRARLYEECIDVLLEHWREAKRLPMSLSAQDGRRALQPAALWLHSEKGRTRATATELSPVIEPVLKGVAWSGGGPAEFLPTIRDESGLLTGWDQDHYGFMHLGFQEYLAAREIRTQAFKDPSVLKALAENFGDSWWQEVGLLLLALEDPSLFVPYMRMVVRQEAFSRFPELVEMCIDDAAEVSFAPFTELLGLPAGDDQDLWKRQLTALTIMERKAPEALEKLQSNLEKHPYPAIRERIRGKAAREAQDVIHADPSGYELVRIPGGAFMMGSPETEDGRFDREGPQHRVKVAPFYMGRYPVTNELYSKFLADHPKMSEPVFWADRKYNQPNQPVVGVNWKDAKKYAEWAGQRLPSEAEWEYACRANTRTRYHSGDSVDDLDRVGWYGNNSGGKFHPVGEKEPNSFGLYDMHGNVWEWVEDDYHDDFKGAPIDCSAWVNKPRGGYRVIRGGGWYDDALSCRSAYRGSYAPDERYFFLGFRLSRSVTLGP